MVRIHRIAATSLAGLLVLTGCSGDPDATPTGATGSATPTASSPSPTPTAEPAAVLAYGGDCANIVSDDEAIGLVGDLGGPVPTPELLWSLESDRSAAIIGGLLCAWSASDYSGFSVGAFPQGVVPADLLGRVGDMECDEYSGCEGAQLVGDTWVDVGSASETVTKGASELIASRPDAAGSPSPGPWGDTWWAPLTDCSVMQDAVASALGVPTIQPEFPSDTLPIGPVVDVLRANGVVVECPWFSYESSTGAIVYVQPGIGAPPPNLTAQAGVVPAEVTGADSAFFVSSGDSRPRLLAVSGPNRVTIEGLPGVTEAVLAPVATAVLGVLDATG